VADLIVSGNHQRGFASDSRSGLSLPVSVVKGAKGGIPEGIPAECALA